MAKIQMKNKIAELDGDEMTRVLWQVIKDELLTPYVDLQTEYYDLGLKNRDDSDDKITYEAAAAIKRLGVGVKCATITSNAARVKEYNLKQLTPSPNGIIRAELDGTVFRTPIFVKNVQSTVSCWKKPIILGRHAYGDVYKNCEIKTPCAGKAELVFTGEDGTEIRKTIMDMKGPGIIQGIHNLDKSIESFARCCFTYALDQKVSVWFGAKDTISKTYDGDFKAIFQNVFDTEFKDSFEKAGIEYFYTLIDDCVARIMKHEGGIMWACKNYDGDVMSDMVASACGSLAMMTSVLVSPDGKFEYEASHGTVQKHYYRYQKGEKTSTNPVALIFAWTGALAKRGELDGTPELVEFAKRLEKATLDTIEAGIMTGDIARIASPAAKKVMNSWDFIAAIKERL
ncbi:MAG: NADP-dependent isocitrate dehydrogenase [Treponema porcinum]|uniref:NADP-dependent isocitrate dehydrogenase n=1 Tax=Treponema porcinum TaxID=261392 RepID=UPI0023564D39|nr:NADP-dependent isocitrate dehydrogenase [Treponema porcinum]MCI6179883.1 NADP-dependent isocitrate dehydrogenase [Treponema porcinum]MCI6983680.1 NADP-dependent isocitrate dehydrogenase [Treponema porcinum]MCI7080160.1 NADP-dependent isocitrate dehydrogenase [Treponema porcinum]MCI7114669.1 NADP-dependent isocitrate dehydrogenase [Treponema porcinum]MCI7546137.1 NADP-dependent isocitrate dehydrogenase [Treponema porcinum]